MSAFCGLYWPSMHPTGSNSSEHFYIILFFPFCSRNRIAPPSMFIYFDNLMKRIHAPVLRIIRNQCDEFDMSCAVKRKSIQMCIGCYFYFFLFLHSLPFSLKVQVLSVRGSLASFQLVFFSIAN